MKYSFSKMLALITFRQELYVTMVLAPFAMYFIFFGGQFSLAQITTIIIAVLVADVVGAFVHFFLHYNKLKTIYNLFDNITVNAEAIKRETLKFSWLDVKIVAPRWIGSILIAFLILYLLLELTTIQIIAIFLLPVFSIPFTISLFYFAGERIITRLLDDPLLRNTHIDKKSIRSLSENARKILMIASIAIFPTVMLGYFFVLANNFDVTFSNLPVHFTIIGVLTINAVAATLFESSRSTTSTINDLIHTIEEISSGNLKTETISTKSNSELGFVSQNLNRLLLQLQETTSTIKKASDIVVLSSSEITNSADRLATAATEQAANVEQTSSTLEEISATVEHNSQNAANTNTIALKAAEKSNEGKSIINESIASMDEIAKKIEIVEDIAYQTDLLSLNAAIEAARAGQHGKGFAVVANEVRKLAEKSQTASKEINTLVSSSRVVSHKAKELFSNLLPEIGKTAELVNEITRASQEQASGIEQVNKGVYQLNDITQQNAAAAEELSSTATALSENAENLKNSIDYFKL